MIHGLFFSHATAAALYGLPLPTRVRDAEIDVSCVLPARAPKGRGVTGHALATGPTLTEIDGLPVPEPAEVWCQLAAILTVDELVIAGDALLRRKHPLCAQRTLQEAVSAAGCRPGVRKLRQAIELVRARTDSPMESVLRLAIIRAGLTEPAVNYAIADATGRIRASGDLVFPAARVVVEYDGDHHRSDRRQWNTDIDRLYIIESIGWRVVRINSAHMADGAREALARIRSALRSSGPNTP
ncbi:endonuclease domain-containing protein [Leifsonia poae]|uniref:endonuclease domain-containing protein n=1 Tax=Leifsonia poae TaxID=110933 RepID=UPI003D6840F3